MVKSDVEMFDEKLETQTVHEAYINFEDTLNELYKLGYGPKRCREGQKTKRDKWNLMFTLKSGAIISISSEGQPHRIQTIWNLMEQSEKQFCELTSVLVPLVGKKLIIVSVSGLVHNQDSFPTHILENKLLLQFLTPRKDT
jgi:hypothetical protein